MGTSWTFAGRTRFAAALALGLAGFGLAAPGDRAHAQDATAAAAASDLQGTLIMQWADPRRGAFGGGVTYQLVKDDGTIVPLDVPNALHVQAVGAFNKRVSVKALTNAATAGGAPAGVTAITPLDTGVSAQRATTTRKLLLVLLKYKGETQVPHPPAFYKNEINALTPDTSLGVPGTVNQFFRQTSWNKLQFKGDVVGTGGLAATGWLTLPGTKADYANCGWSGVCAQLGKIVTDAVALVDGVGVDASTYDSISFVLNNDLDCCAWGGGASVKGKVIGATWMPPWSQDASVYVHELGHSIGLPHSGWRYYAYDSRWDQMSDGASSKSLSCGSYVSANSGGTNNLTCQAAGAGYIAAHKSKMGWLPSANVAVVNTKSTKTFTLSSIGTGLGRSLKMIKICLSGQACTGTTAHYLTVEAKVKSTFSEGGLPGEGVIIHDFQENRAPVGAGNACYFNTQSGWAMPIDATAGDYSGAPNCNAGGRTFPNYALHNAQYTPGKTYSNTRLGVKVEVLSRSGSTYSVRVTRTK